MELDFLDHGSEETAPIAEPEGSTVIEETPAEQPDLSAQARKMGWKPQEEYTGNPSKWVDADEFIKRGSPEYLRREVDRTRQEFEKFRKEQLAVTKSLVEQTRAQAKAEHEAKIAQLEAKHREGFEKGDYETMRAAERARQEAERNFASSQTPIQDSVSPVFEDFYSRNGGWYGKDPELTEEADAFGIGLAERVKARKLAAGLAPSLTSEEEKEIFNRVEKRFKPSVRTQPPPSLGAARQTPTRGKGKTVADLDPQNLSILRHYQKQGLYTGAKAEQDFVNDLFSMGN